MGEQCDVSVMPPDAGPMHMKLLDHLRPAGSLDSPNRSWAWRGVPQSGES